MINSSNLPIYKVVFYLNNPETGYYTKTETQPEKTPVLRLPFQLRVEPTQLHQIKCNAAKIIRGKELYKNGSFKFFTGIQETNFPGWFAGNDYEMLSTGKKLTLCLFHFSEETGRLTVYYFSRFYIENRDARQRFINDVIRHVLQPQLV